jgi:hypothetical protein
MMDDLPTPCFNCSRDRLRKLDPAAAAVARALATAAQAGNIMGLFLILRDLGEGRIPSEVKGEVRPETDTLTFDKFCQVWEGVYRISDDSTQHMMLNLRPLLEWQLGFQKYA